MATEDVVRVLRLIEYEGPRSKVEKQLINSMKSGTHQHGNGVTIRIATLGDFPTILDAAVEQTRKRELEVAGRSHGEQTNEAS